MASRSYNDWVASIKAVGGRVAVSPKNVPSAAYPATVWAPRVNNKFWPLPNEYSANGNTGYYHAPEQLQDEIRQFGLATADETKAGANALMDQWQIPAGLRGIGAYFKSLGLIALVAVGAYVVITRQGRRDSY